MRGCEDSSPVELEYDGSDMMYSLKNYAEILKDASLAKRRGVDVSGVNCSTAHENIIPFSVSIFSLAISQQSLMLVSSIQELFISYGN